MIAGEFAVLEPRKKLVAMAVNRFVYATIKDNEENSVTLDNLELYDASWDYHNKRMKINTKDPRVRFVEFAMNITLNYLEEQSIPVSKFSLTIKSELNDESGIKYGLGSSAAVVTAVTVAILKKFLPEPPPANLIFKLASISHAVIQGNGSGADIAASSYGGFIEYTSFQAEWLIDAYQTRKNLTSLIEQDWIYCSIKRLTLPESLHILIGWTGKPASTSQLVKNIRELKRLEPDKYEQFLLNSEKAVNRFLLGVKEENVPLILKAIEENRQALSVLGEHAGVEIETELLSKLSELTRDYAGAGKLSGAGGGDCGIAFLESADNYKQLTDAWKEVGIKPLSITPYLEGPTLI